MILKCDMLLKKQVHNKHNGIVFMNIHEFLMNENSLS